MTAVAARPDAPPVVSGSSRRPPRSAPPGPAGAWVWALAAVVLGGAAAVWPLPAVAVLGGAAILALAFTAPYVTAALAALAVLFVRPVEHLVPIAQLGYLDEGLVVLCAVTMPLRRVLSRRPLRNLPGQWWFAAFLVCGVLSALVLHVPAAIFLTGAFVIAKGLLFGWAVAQLDWTERHLAVAVRVGTVLILLSLAAAAVNVAIPGAWQALMASDANAVESRSFLPSLIGPFSHPIDFGQFMALSFLAVAAWRTTVRKGPLTFVLLLATALCALGTARRTAAGSIAAAWLWMQLKVRSTAVLVALAACLPVAVVALASPVSTIVAVTYHDYLGKGTPEARTVLTVDSFKIAAGYFPGGAGFGRFGSAVAAENYSPEYVALGYPTVWGLGRTEEDGRFLTDTEWPAIIGESGFLGALAFAVGLAGIYRFGLRLWRTGPTRLARWAGLTSAAWLVAGLVQSVATVTFTGPPVYGLIFGLAGVVAALSDPVHRDAAPVRAGRRPDR